MSYVLIAASVYLAAQAGAGEFQPLRARGRQAAPPASAPAASAPAAAPEWDLPAEESPSAPQNAPPAAAAAAAPAAAPAADPYADPYAETQPPARQPARQPAARQPAARQPAARQPAARPPLQRERPSAAAAAAAPPPAEAGQPMQDVGARPPQRLRPPELIAEALENPKHVAAVGTPLTLAQALAGTVDRSQQLVITKAYWRLATAQARYHWSLDERDLLREHTDPQASEPAVLSARAAAQADVRTAQIAVERVRAELDALLPPRRDRKPPVATDRPHVGEYRTNYEAIFSNRPAPTRLQLVNRTLPVRRQAIDAHADAILAAQDAVEATGEQFRASGQGLATLLDSIELLRHERQAFIAEVREYNVEIADYAFAVAPGGAPSQTLVSMLIRNAAPDATRTADPAQPQLRKTFRPRSRGADGTSLRTSQSARRTTRYQAAEEQDWYAGLLDVTNRPVRVQKLGNLMHWDRNLPAEAGEPASLADCLRGVPRQDSLAVIEAFWLARERAAALQLLYDQFDQLNALQPLAIPRGGEVGLAEAGVRLQAARQANRAALLDAQAELMIAQAELLEAMGRPASSGWIMPATPPQAGRYLVSAAARRGQAPGSRWAERIELEYDKLQSRADAVMQADAHRMQLVLVARQAGPERPHELQMTTLDEILRSIRRQNQLARGFLGDLTEYNRAIANYALVSLPESVSGPQLAAKLAISRSTVRDS